MTDKEREIRDRFEKYLFENDVSNEFLLEIIKVVFDYGNVMTVKDYADSQGISPQGVYACRETEKINNIRFVINNEL
jgi:hypothetical protein